MASQVKKQDKASLTKLQAFEVETGLCVVALDSQPMLVNLSESQLKKLQFLEKDMKAILVAYECHL